MAGTVAVPENAEGSPLTYVITKWWAYCFCAMYLLYGGVKVILGFLDRNYSDMGAPLISLVVGLGLAVVSIAYRDKKSWRWYGMVTLNLLIALGTAVLLAQRLDVISNGVLLLVAAIALAALFAPATKEYIFGRR